MQKKHAPVHAPVQNYDNDDDDDDDDDIYIMMKCLYVCNVFAYFKKCLETGETTKSV